jgi:hypothetical protein
MPEENDNDNIAEENEEQNFTVENPSLDLEVRITINVPVVYMARDVMILMQATSISRASGRGGP